ncbi:MAG: homoserine kinase [Ignavibacteria bacterium]|nr:homoserine kinase [Ignavibacteria bacterium]
MERKLNKNRASAFAPATVSNVGPGFDVMGYAIYGLGDVVETQVSLIPGVRIAEITGNFEGLPLAAESNTAGGAVIAMAAELGFDKGIDITIRKNMPSGSGLGSSAASAVAAVTAVNAMLDNPLAKEDLIPFALAGEALASGGAIHGDNVIPSLLGGFTLIKDAEQNLFFTVPIPGRLYSVLLHPDIVIQTSYARSILPKEVAVKTAVRQAANSAILTAGLLLQDSEMIRSAIEDVFAEPYRKSLIPGYDEVRLAAMQYNALGFNISGSGPTVFALFANEPDARAAAVFMEQPFLAKGFKVDLIISEINPQGSQVLGVQ